MYGIGGDKIACLSGASGFIGNHLARALLDSGWKLRRLTRESAVGKTDEKAFALGAVQCFSIGRGSSPDLREALDGVSVFFNLAGVLYGRSESEFIDGNVEFTKKIIGSVQRDRGTGFHRFIHISSLAATGPSLDGIPINENIRPNPIGWYGKSKLEGERAILEQGGRIPVTIIRPCAVYGPGDRAFLQLFRFMRYGPAAYPASNCRISLIHVEDLIEGIMKATEGSTPSGSIYNLSGDGTIRHGELCTLIAGFHGRSPIKIPLPPYIFRFAAGISELSALASGRTPYFNRQKAMEICAGNWLCDNSKAKVDFGFSPRWGIDAGLGATFEHYRLSGLLGRVK